MTDIIESVPKQRDAQQLAAELVEKARAEGIDLVGPGGLLTGLTKTVSETALEAEMTEHLGCDKHDPTGRGRARWAIRWKPALNAFAITFEGRIVPSTTNRERWISYTEDRTVPGR